MRTATRGEGNRAEASEDRQVERALQAGTIGDATGIIGDATGIIGDTTGPTAPHFNPPHPLCMAALLILDASALMLCNTVHNSQEFTSTHTLLSVVLGSAPC